MSKLRPPQRRPITLTDIARGCGVSRATVSLVLRESPLVRDETRERVKAELRRQNYIYNRAAANLRRQTSSTIALVLNDLANPFFAEFASGVDDHLTQAGYVTLLGQSNESLERERRLTHSLLEHAPAALILSPVEAPEELALLEQLSSQLPVLLFNREPAEVTQRSWDLLQFDNYRGAYLATRHLLAQGHRQLAFYGGYRHQRPHRERLAGFTQALQEAGLSFDPRLCIEFQPRRTLASEHVQQLFAHGLQPTGAVCYNDIVALGLIGGLKSVGRQPGVDFALTGFDDIYEAGICTPALSTVQTRPRECGRQAAIMILERLANPGSDPACHVSPVEFTIRDSSPPPTESNHS
ncbi:LacI family DNA-binding transcriptional regulator [Frateuria aurantia]